MRGAGERAARPQLRLQEYSAFFNAIPGEFFHRPDVDEGGKMLLPASVLGDIANMTLQYPLQFEIVAQHSSGEVTRTHCGVLEFTASEGQVVLPLWLMQTTLRINPMHFVSIRAASPRTRLH